MSHNGELNWLELQTKKPEEAMKFYNQLYGWSFVSETNEHGDVYWLISNEGKFPFGGILTLDEKSQVNSRWVTYFQVEDVNSAVQVVVDNDGKIINGPREVKGVGRVAWLQDQEGAEFCVIAPCKAK
jgi:predicted enzyme related to lactoylglutathione lyase